MQCFLYMIVTEFFTLNLKELNIYFTPTPPAHAPQKSIPDTIVVHM